MYVARRTMDKKEGKPDQSGYHLIVLAKNEKGYHNLIKLVSRAWTMGYYMRPRTDRNELEKYHEGLIVCSACIGGEVPKKIINDQLEEAEEAIRWYKNLFGDDYYLELQRHKATVSRANHEAYPLQQKANAKLLEYARKYNIKVICSNDVHFVDEENAEAHDRLICLSTGKDLDDPSRMLYTKQEWMKTKAEMNELFADVPEALSNTLEILDKVEYYSIDHAPIMPTFAIPEDFGTEEEYRRKYTEKICSMSLRRTKTEMSFWTRKPPKPKSSVWAVTKNFIVLNWKPTILPNWHLTVPNGFTVTRCRTK